MSYISLDLVFMTSLHVFATSLLSESLAQAYSCNENSVLKKKMTPQARDCLTRHYFLISSSLQCRHILGGRNLVRVRIIVVAAIFDFTPSLWEVSTWLFREQIVRPKKTPALQAIIISSNMYLLLFLLNKAVPI